MVDTVAVVALVPKQRREKDVTENSDYAKFVLRAIRALGKRASDDADCLVLLRDIGREWDRVLDQAARACHDAGWSWGEIGTRLGVTRQAAQKRWARPGDRTDIEEETA